MARIPAKSKEKAVKILERCIYKNATYEYLGSETPELFKLPCCD